MPRTTPNRGFRGVALAGAFAFASLIAALACDDNGYRAGAISSIPEAPSDRPIEERTAGYVSSDACQSCHPAAYESWSASFHHTMTQDVSADNVIADFDDVRLELEGRRYVMELRGDECWAEIDDPDWEGEGEAPRVWRQIVMSTGSHHFQAFWYSAGRGRELNCLKVCWRIDEARWIPVGSAFILPPEMSIDLSGRWNNSCYACHTVKGEPRLRRKRGADTRVKEFGIACEACHGPGEEHVRVNRDPIRRYSLHASDESDPTIVNPTKLEGHRSSQVCGQCHAISVLKTDDQRPQWRKTGYEYQPGDNLADSRGFIFEGDSYYWDDGIVRLAGREFSAFLKSPCFAESDEMDSITCFSCHRMHPAADDPRPLEEWRVDQLDMGMEGNRACVQCHVELEGDDKVVAHTHHGAGSPGSSCYNCHMPYTAWSLLGAIRSHTVTSPSVEESTVIGRPNACNLCHLDKPLRWTRTWLSDWWGVPKVKLSADEKSVAASVLWVLSGDAAMRSIVAWHFGWSPAQRTSGADWMPPFLAQLLEDPYDAVRFTAVRSLHSVPGFAGFEHDFLASKPERSEARRRVLESWGSGFSSDRILDAVLIRDNKLQLDALLRLLSNRDDRPVILTE